MQDTGNEDVPPEHLLYEMSGIDALVMREVSRLVTLNDRMISKHTSGHLVGMKGNGLKIDVDRRRGKAWIKYEVVRVIEAD